MSSPAPARIRPTARATPPSGEAAHRSRELGHDRSEGLLDDLRRDSLQRYQNPSFRRRESSMSDAVHCTDRDTAPTFAGTCEAPKDTRGRSRPVRKVASDSKRFTRMGPHRLTVCANYVVVREPQTVVNSHQMRPASAEQDSGRYVLLRARQSREVGKPFTNARKSSCRWLLVARTVPSPDSTGLPERSVTRPPASPTMTGSGAMSS
jgi:hypothetical protein